MESWCQKSMTELTNKIEQKPIGWWVVTTPNGETWATDRYADDSYEKSLSDAIATFGEGTTITAK